MRGAQSTATCAQELILSLTNDKTLIVPGHGPLARRADVEKSLWTDARSPQAHRRADRQGLTEEEVLARRPLEDLDPFFAIPQNDLLSQ